MADHITWFSSLDSAGFKKVRKSVRETAMKAEWELFFPHYLKSYGMAKKECTDCMAGQDKKGQLKIQSQKFRGADSPRPRFRQVSVKSSLPAKLERLREIASNLWWSWKPEAMDLFSSIDPALFEKVNRNPVYLLETADPAKLKTMASNDNYMQQYENVLKAFDRYISDKSGQLWDNNLISNSKPVAYFSMEYGFHECLPIYSGGLGILSGDHIKSASDLNLPLVGIGLIYKKGYFNQTIGSDGEQRINYLHNDFFRMPLRELRKNGKRLTVGIDYPGRTVYARVWEIRVGRIPVYFLDTDIHDQITI